MKKLLAILTIAAALCAPVSIQACGGGDAIVSGYVRDETGRAIRYAKVSVLFIYSPWEQEPAERITYTNNYGFYTFDLCVASDYVIQASHRNQYYSDAVALYPIGNTSLDLVINH